MHSHRIYLDHAATTPVRPEVAAFMEPYQTAFFGNASSVHAFGREARAGVDYAKTQLAAVFGCHPKEVLCTSGATESNNIAIRGFAAGLAQHRDIADMHIVVSAIEHPSVLEPVRELERTGASVTVVAPGPDGRVSADAVAAAITPQTVLVSVMYVNNETGVVQPVRDIGKAVERANELRSKEKERQRRSPNLAAHERVYMHTDAVQAALWYELNADHLHVDLMTLSSHKFGGPKGAGALYVRSGTPVGAIMFGGSQEYGIRPGTYNVPALAGMGKAADYLRADAERVGRMRDAMLELLLALIPDAELNGSRDDRAPNTINLFIPGMDAENALIALDGRGIAVSAGAACASGSIDPSPALLAMGCSRERAMSSLRITLGVATADADCERAAREIASVARPTRPVLD